MPTGVAIAANGQSSKSRDRAKVYRYDDEQSVSTISDECKRVGLETGTKPKRKTVKADDMVSASGDGGCKCAEQCCSVTATVSDTSA